MLRKLVKLVRSQRCFEYNYPFKQELFKWVGYYFFYRLIMKVTHKFHWHYAPPVYPGGDTMLVCKWCGFSQVVKKRDYKPVLEVHNDQTVKTIS